MGPRSGFSSLFPLRNPHGRLHAPRILLTPQQAPPRHHLHVSIPEPPLSGRGVYTHLGSRPARHLHLSSNHIDYSTINTSSPLLHANIFSLFGIGYTIDYQSELSVFCVSLRDKSVEKGSGMIAPNPSPCCTHTTETSPACLEMAPRARTRSPRLCAKGASIDPAVAETPLTPVHLKHHKNAHH